MTRPSASTLPRTTARWSALSEPPTKRKIYIVDYDIPVERRQAFYAALKRLYATLGIVTHSTKSVLVFDKYEVAVRVFNLAMRYGTANLYEATPILSSRSRSSESPKQTKG